MFVATPALVNAGRVITILLLMISTENDYIYPEDIKSANGPEYLAHIALPIGDKKVPGSIAPPLNDAGGVAMVKKGCCVT